MTAISLLVTNVTNAIEALSISGVTIRDYDGIAASWVSIPNVMYLNPENGIVFSPPEYPAIGRGSGAAMDISYVLNYRFLANQIGDLATLPLSYGQMFAKVVSIYNVIATTDSPYSGRVYMELGRVSIGARADPAGNMYNGADFEIRITEQHN